jgi:hypothetical protein
MPSSSSPSNKPHFPRGECRFIMLHPSSIGDQRCSCPGFRQRKNHPGAHCECGHQACYHSYHGPGGASPEEDTTSTSTSVSSHKALLERVHYLESQHRRDRRLWEEQLREERHARSEDVRVLREAMSRFFHFMEQVVPEQMVVIEDRIDGLVDVHEQLQERVIAIDDSSMALEDRILDLESSLPLDDLRQDEKKEHVVKREEQDGIPEQTVGTGSDLDDFLRAGASKETTENGTVRNRGSTGSDKSAPSISRGQTAISVPATGAVPNCRSSPVSVTESAGYQNAFHNHKTPHLFEDRTPGQPSETKKQPNARSVSLKKRKRYPKDKCSRRYPDTFQHHWTLPDPPPLSLSESILNIREKPVT